VGEGLDPLNMTIEFFTIVRDGMPFVTWHHQAFKFLKMPWRWNVVIGTARNVHCTSWCNEIVPAVSEDGTDKYFESLSKFDSRVRVFKSAWWNGKIAMCNTPIDYIMEPVLLWQVDADEIWTTKQIENVVGLFDVHRDMNCAYFWCRYFVGPNIVITSRDTYGNQSAYEWHRVWRCEPGMRWKTHEPPVLNGFDERPIRHQETELAGCVFDHYAYATEEVMRFKERYYPSCNGAMDGWKRLQRNRKWPVKELKEFLPWVGEGVTADLL
jgi:Glycosyl transferase family 2